jgi:hypothetical protein
MTETETVTIAYRVPVYVTVDLTYKKVTSVKVDDGAAEFDDDFRNPIVHAARQIAQGAEWPSWEFGL